MSVAYTVTDGADLATARLVITVRPVNDPVVAIADAVTIAEDSGPVTGNLLDNDRAANPDGPAENLSVIPNLIVDPVRGTVGINGNGTYTYIPATNFNGTFTVPYTVTDGTSAATGTLTIVVTPVNDPITAIDEAVAIDEDAAPISGDVLANERNANPDGLGEVLTVTDARSVFSAVGTVDLWADGTYLFTPTADAHGTVSVQYTVSDGTHQATGQLVITVRPVNDPVLAVADTATTKEDSGPVIGNVLTNDRAANPDGPGENLTVTPVVGGDALRGFVRIESDGTYTYTPAPNFNGTITAPYTVTDGTFSTLGLLTIVVTPVNDAPTAPVVVADTLTPDQLSGKVTSTATSTDVDGDTLVFSGSTTTAKGSVVVNANGTFTYTPSQVARETMAGTADSFTITVSDGTVTRSTVVTVSIAPVNVVLGTIAVGVQANGIGVTPDGARAYVANQQNASVSVIDLVTGREIKVLGVAPTPTSIAMSPNGTRAYVTSQSGAVTVINTTDDSIVTSISTSAGALGLAVSPDGARVFVTHTQGTRIIVLDAVNNRVLTSIDVGERVRGIAVSSDGSTLYATAFDANRLLAVNTATGGKSVIVNGNGSGFNRIVLSPDGARAYVTHNQSGMVSVVDLNTKQARAITVQAMPNGLVLSPDGSRLYVTGHLAVTVIDTVTDDVVGYIYLNADSRGVTVSADGTKLYVTSDVIGSGGPSKVTIVAIGNLGANPIGL